MMSTLPETLIENTRQLLFHPQPQDFETLPGYLLRVADLNCLQHPQELLDFLEQKAETIYRAPLTPQLGVYSLGTLAQQLKQPLEKIVAMAWPLDIRVGKHRRFLYQGLTWPLELLRHDYRAWCPYCLSERLMHRADWDWHLSTCCHKHQTILLDRCPACFKRVSWRYASLNRCNCGFPLHTAQSIPVEKYYDSIEICTLTATEIQRYIILALLILKTPSGAISTKSLSEITPEELNLKIGQISTQSLRDHESFYNAIDFHLEERYRNEPTLGPRYATAPLAQGLKIDKNFDQELIKITNRWLARDKVIAEIHVQTGSPQSQKNLTIEVAGYILNVSHHILHRLIKKKVLVSVSESGCLANTARLSRKDLFVSGKSLSQLQHFLVQKNSATQGQSVSFDHYGIDFSTRLNLLNDLLEGKATSLAYNPCIGLPSLELIIPTKQAASSKFLSVREAAKILKIYPDAIYRVAKSGLLPYTPHLARQIKIDVNDLGKFHQDFIFTREIADKLSCNATNLADKIISAGVMPVHGPSIDGGLLYVFRRQEVETLDLVTVSQSNYQSRCGRGHKSQLTSQAPNLLLPSDACKFLDVKPRQLDRLYHLGFLMPIQLLSEGQPCLDKIELEEYLANYKNNNMLIRIEDVKLKMRISTTLWNDLVNLELIRPITDGIVRYVYKDQLAEAIKYRSTIFSTKQLSEASGICKAMIRWEAKYGCLADTVIRTSNSYPKLFFPKAALFVLKKQRSPQSSRTGK
ncbi:TniQ family protein [Aquitalea sp.]|uniref:TniQ family protein n=1 Tax=Aquitalea sp. TaxID=1872623 RepID=UPI002590091E|nr:TniQ family protein [Aquitalea sp.]